MMEMNWRIKMVERYLAGLLTEVELADFTRSLELDHKLRQILSEEQKIEAALRRDYQSIPVLSHTPSAILLQKLCEGAHSSDDPSLERLVTEQREKQIGSSSARMTLSTATIVVGIFLSFFFQGDNKYTASQSLFKYRHNARYFFGYNNPHYRYPEIVVEQSHIVSKFDLAPGNPVKKMRRSRFKESNNKDVVINNGTTASNYVDQISDYLKDEGQNYDSVSLIRYDSIRASLRLVSPINEPSNLDLK